MILSKRVPSAREAEQLGSMLADARAIPAAAFARSAGVAQPVLDLTDKAGRDGVVRIPDVSLTLIEAAEQHVVGYRR